jgi:AcrR family transcriptional regulator
VPPTKERTPALRSRILDAALDTLVAEGVAGVTTRRIAALAGTSPPAIYELFGHKAGLVRELFYEGFRRLLAAFEELATSDDPVTDLVATIMAFRGFANSNQELFAVMYSRPFDVYEPNRDERRVGDSTRRFVVEGLERCRGAGRIVADPLDSAHGLLGLAIGLATQETAGWLGSTEESRHRRWTTAVAAFILGLNGERPDFATLPNAP